MKFLEKNLEDIIYSQLKTEHGREELMSRGLFCGGESLSKRQLKIGNYGTCDLITLYRPCRNKKDYANYQEDMKPIITIYELKLDEIGLGAIIQACKYAKGVKNYLRRRNLQSKYRIQIVLIGSKISPSDWVYMFDVLDLSNIEVYTYDYQIDGIYFIEQPISDFDITNNGI